MQLQLHSLDCFYGKDAIQIGKEMFHTGGGKIPATTIAKFLIKCQMVLMARGFTRMNGLSGGILYDDKGL